MSEPRWRLRPFLAGALAGLVAGTALGSGVALAAVTLHPHFGALVAGQLRGHLHPTLAPPADLGRVVVRIQAGAAGRPISPFIYGVANADPVTLRTLGATLDRWGGNNQSRYNWANGHAWNAARDWGFRNGNYGHPTGSAADDFVAGAQAAGAASLLTVPALGWVARDDDNRSASVGVPSHGGAPIGPGSDAIPGYDPTSNRQRTSVRSEPQKPGSMSDPPDPHGQVVYQDEWVHHLVDRFGPAPKGVRFYAVDNEPDLWAEVHTDVHPVRMGYDDMLRVYERYATAVKAQDPGAKLLGPDVSGWTGYFYSALDRGDDNFATHADRTAHGGTPFLVWWLTQVAAQDRARGQRSLDYLDVHYYPQGSGVFEGRSDPATRELRIRSVRSLWDASYTDESWIGTSVELIPRLRSWIDRSYPGTLLAITEYSWGAEKDPSGAVALAEALGTFGRLGVDLACYWMFPPPYSPAGAAFRLYRTYDGKGATFGDISIPASSSEPGVAAFAARHSKGKELDVILVNESSDQTARTQLEVDRPHYRATDTYRVVGSSGQIQHDSVLASEPMTLSLPPYSVTLVRLEAA